MCQKCTDKEKLIKIRDEADFFIRANDDRTWAKGYTDDPTSYKKLLKAEAAIMRAVKKYFKKIAPKIVDAIDWKEYESLLPKTAAEKKKDFLVDISWEDDDFDGLFVDLTYEPISDAALAGLASAQKEYAIKTAPKDLADTITDGVKDYCGKLITKIDETTRENINNTIADGIASGKSTDEMKSAILDEINNEVRAEMIARTESVNAYNSGRTEYAKSTGAISKEWQTNAGACEICLDNEAQGAIGIDEDFSSGDSEPASHPNCRCGTVYNYDTSE